MIKKYFIEPNSLFNKSIILSLFEPGKFSFKIEGLSLEEQHQLFPSINKIKVIKNEVDISSVPSSIVVAYLDESLIIKALVMQDSKKKYYLFKVHHQKPND